MGYRKVTRFVSAADGTQISYHTHLGNSLGEEEERTLSGRVPVLLTNGAGTSENFWRYLVEALTPEHRVVHWDYRGHGASERAVSQDYSMQAHVDDLIRVTEAVMAHGDGSAPIHIAFSMGVTVVLELYRRRPELVPAMALLAGGPDAPWSSKLPFRLPGAMASLQWALGAVTPVVPVVAPLVRAFLSSRLAYPAGRMTGVLRQRAPREDIEQFMRALCAMDPLAYWNTLRGLMSARASDVLPRVRVPVLVVAATHDTFVPLSDMAIIPQALPTAQYLEVQDAGHATLLEAGTEVATEVGRFIKECLSSRS